MFVLKKILLNLAKIRVKWLILIFFCSDKNPLALGAGGWGEHLIVAVVRLKPFEVQWMDGEAEFSCTLCYTRFDKVKVGLKVRATEIR